MTEKKKIPEQMALYYYNSKAGGAGPAAATRMSEEETGHERSPRRVVTVPEADLSTAGHTFSQRREQWRRSHARPQRYVAVARTFAQTGSPAPGGRVNANRRPLPYHKTSVPRRSGQLHRPRSFLWRLLSIFAIGAIIIAISSFLLNSDTFRVQQVNVVGTHNDALIQNIQHISTQRQNIFLLNVTSLDDQIKALPLVSSVELTKQLPNQLTATIVERTPVLLWRTTQGTYSVDGQGMIIALTHTTPTTDQPGTVVDITGSYDKKKSHPLQPGDRLDAANILFAANVLKKLPQVSGITTFKLNYDGTMYASTPGDGAQNAISRGAYIIEGQAGWKAYLGGAYDANPLENRLLELRGVLNLAQQQQLNIATIDLRYGLHPVFTVKK